MQQWNAYRKRLPRPKATVLQQQLVEHGRYKLANLYLEHMEIGMLAMMRDQCKRLLVKVDSRDRPLVRNQIKRLEGHLERAYKLKAEQEAFSAARQRQVVKRATNTIVVH